MDARPGSFCPVEALAGRYQLIDLIGTGGMGSVWRAWDLRKRTYVAAKVLGQHDAGMLLRFVREQSLRIQHQHVVAPHGWAAEDDKVVFAMDLVRGGSVATLLGDHGPLPTAYVAVLLDQILHGLSAIHAAGVVHRDLKPANLLLEATGTALPHLRISDFGIAGLVDEPRMTRHSTILGTPGYFPPEQLLGADPDPRQDLYTVGAVATELLTGNRPTPSTPITPPDGPLADLIHHLTSEDPSTRPATAPEAARLLAASGALPLPNTTPWTTQPDPPEVFDQLPPLPTPWTPTGPPAPRRTASSSPTPASAPTTPPQSPAQPAAPTRPTPAAPSAAPTRPTPADPSPSPQPSPRPRPTSHPTAGAPARTSPPSTSTPPQQATPASDLHRPSPTHTPAPAPAPAPGPGNLHQPGPSSSAHTPANRVHSLPVGANSSTPLQPTAAAPTSPRLLIWLAAASFLGALALAAAATWLLLR